MYDLAIAVHQMQGLVGQVRQMHAIGKGSKKLLKMLSRFEQERPNVNETSSAGANNESLIDNMLIVDRDIDFVATLISQLNYEGLLDETFGIEVCMSVCLFYLSLDRLICSFFHFIY